jgi:Tfp pilus assembly protein FimT
MKRLTLLLVVMVGLAFGYRTIEARISSVTGGGGATAGVSDTAYNATTWDGVTDTAPSKNAVRDKIETISGGDVTDVGDCASGDCDDPYFTEVGGTTIKAGTDGISLVGSNGAVTLLGTGDGEDENLVLDFNSTANTVGISSTTGVTVIDFGSIGITSTGTVDLSGATTTFGTISSTDWVTQAYMANDAIGMDEIDEDAAFTSLTGNWFTTGTLGGRLGVTDDGTDNNVAKTEMNALIHDNDGDTWVLADIDAADGLGWSLCIYGDGANAITVDPDAEDIIIDTFDDGGAESAGEAITSGGAAGDMICLVVIKFSGDVAYWAVTAENGTWTPAD